MDIKRSYEIIRGILDKARQNVFRAVNSAMVSAYWQIGKIIVEEQKGLKRASYGKFLIKGLSRKLTKEYGKGFKERNLWHMKDFYLKFPKLNALRSELTWTHYRLILRINRNEARDFYVIEAIKSNWSTRELDRQINSMLFERIADKIRKIYIYDLTSHILRLQ